MNLKQRAAELDGYRFTQSGYGWWVSHTNKARTGPYSTLREALNRAPDYTGNIEEAKKLAQRQGCKIEFFGINGVKLDGVELDTSKDNRTLAIIKALVEKNGRPSLADEILALSASEAVEYIKRLTVDDYRNDLEKVAAASQFKTVKLAIENKLKD